ncbi:Hypothetical predicted protein [Olea europaea subsp. europaea]|uniref:Uncharacterized protein n=1 Tax=Olea europaea subsp. europaea TaxID=158383 RepID=A0A8S0S667_OLEEU|nr:Hypothetical predicted protein [Olea europaea subsp. europaea]
MVFVDKRGNKGKRSEYEKFEWRVIILVIFCIGVFSIQPEMVSGRRSIDLARRWERGEMSVLRSSRALKAVALQDLGAALNIAPSPGMTYDPNQSEKRRVDRGSDPIHNRC